ncbi:MAG: PAS domain S-box protein [Candidatus Omnitrophota bacterium]
MRISKIQPVVIFLTIIFNPLVVLAENVESIVLSDAIEDYQFWLAGTSILASILVVFVLLMISYNLKLRVSRKRLEAELIQRTEMQKELMRREKNYRELVENANSVILRMDMHGNITFFNRFAQEYFGFTENEILGKNVVGTIVPSIDSTGFELTRLAKEIIEHAERYQFNENENMTKDGRRVWVAWTNRVVDDEKSGSKEILCVGTDMTERRKQQQQLTKLFRAVEQSPVSVVITNYEGIIEYVNPSFFQFTGYSIDEALGQNLRILKSGVHPQEFYKNLWDTITAGKEWRNEICNKKKSGELYWELTAISPIRNVQGVITHFLAIKEDITDRKQAEKVMFDVYNAKNEFISIVSHELRTPLTAIKEGISIVQEEETGRLNKKQLDFLNLAKRNTERLSILINDVLDYQKLEAGRMEFALEEGDINSVIEEVRQTMEPVATNKGIQLHVRFGEDLPRVKFDRNRIFQVLVNLVGNAVKFTDQGSVTIESSRPQQSLHVSVIDTGIGIKAEDMNKLFQSFSQISSEQRKKVGGTGLGLVISRRIMQQHGGDIWVESAIGKGSSFSFWLPVQQH